MSAALSTRRRSCRGPDARGRRAVLAQLARASAPRRSWCSRCCRRICPPGGLAAVSAVLGLSYVLAVPPGAIQLRAAADRRLADRRLSCGLRPGGRARPRCCSCGLAAARRGRWRCPLRRWPSRAFSFRSPPRWRARRGTLIGERRLRSAAASFGVDAACRLFAGVALGHSLGRVGRGCGARPGHAPAAAHGATGELLRARLHKRAPAPRAGEGSTLSYMIAVSAIVAAHQRRRAARARACSASAADGYAVAVAAGQGHLLRPFRGRAGWRCRSRVNTTTDRRLLLAGGGDARASASSARECVLAARPLLPALLRPRRAALAGARAARAGDGVRWHDRCGREHGRRAWRSPGVGEALAAALGLAATALSPFGRTARSSQLGVLLAQLAALASGDLGAARVHRAARDRGADG